MSYSSFKRLKSKLTNSKSNLSNSTNDVLISKLLGIKQTIFFHQPLTLPPQPFTTTNTNELVLVGLTPEQKLSLERKQMKNPRTTMRKTTIDQTILSKNTSQQLSKTRRTVGSHTISLPPFLSKTLLSYDSLPSVNKKKTESIPLSKPRNLSGQISHPTTAKLSKSSISNMNIIPKAPPAKISNKQYIHLSRTNTQKSAFISQQLHKPTLQSSKPVDKLQKIPQSQNVGKHLPFKQTFKQYSKPVQIEETKQSILTSQIQSKEIPRLQNTEKKTINTTIKKS
ncbi:hypothetical protein QTN25_010755 [Entamoeba marina]